MKGERKNHSEFIAEVDRILAEGNVHLTGVREWLHETDAQLAEVAAEPLPAPGIEERERIVESCIQFIHAALDSQMQA